LQPFTDLDYSRKRPDAQAEAISNVIEMVKIPLAQSSVLNMHPMRVEEIMNRRFSKGVIIMRRAYISLLFLLTLVLIALPNFAGRASDDHGANQNMAAYEKALKEGMPVLVNVSSGT
jgi:hypothetical protein